MKPRLPLNVSLNAQNSLQGSSLQTRMICCCLAAGLPVGNPDPLAPRQFHNRNGVNMPLLGMAVFNREKAQTPPTPPAPVRPPPHSVTMTGSPPPTGPPPS